jgi:hypothetical protein
MATVAVHPTQLAHDLIDRLTPAQTAALVQLMRTMINPENPELAHIPFEDEEISEEEERAVAESKEWLKTHEPIPNEEVLAEFGLTVEDFERMGRTPLDADVQKR